MSDQRRSAIIAGFHASRTAPLAAIAGPADEQLFGRGASFATEA